MSDFEKVSMQSPNITSENIKKISEMFPEVLTEVWDEHGRLKKAINFDKLKQILSEEIVDGKENYEFTWVGKRNAIMEAGRPTTKTLRPEIQDFEEWNKTENIYIEGDNLEALKILQESYLGKIKMIYIDPPYNTGQDFIYRDDFKMSNDELNNQLKAVDDTGKLLYENKSTDAKFHSNWLNMMYPRLKLARNLLKEDGAILVSLDEKEASNVRKICDEIFGESNYVGTIAWESKTKSQNTKDSFNKLQPKVENIFLYTKNSLRRFNLIKKGEKKYDFQDEKGVYREHAQEFMNAGGVRGRESMIFEIKGINPPPGKQWKVGKDLVEEFLRREDIIVRDGKVIFKMRPGDERAETTDPFWAFFSKEIGTAESAKKDLNKLLEVKNTFDTVKPVELIKRLIFHITSEDDIVMDFFSGSATTAHAVMKINAEDNGRRKFIMVQLPEKVAENSEVYEAGFTNICEIGKKRIQLAAEEILKANPLFTEKLDLGFKVFHIDESNMKSIYYTPSEIGQQNLFASVENIKEDRTSEDLLYQVMLSLGMELSLKVKKQNMVGCETFDVDNGSLIACFADSVNDEVIRGIASKEPLRAVFKESSFKNSSAKINLKEIFKELSPHTKVKVI